MKLLDDYIFDEQLRYERHRLIYTSADTTPIEFSGILAAGITVALLSVTDEGEARAITLDTPEGRKDFFVRYEKEVLADNGGLLETELQALKDSYLEFTGELDTLLSICRNDRLLDLALGLVVEYMQRLVRERIGEQIYDIHQWKEPFAQWLYDAGYIETRRQYLLAINWTDPASVYDVTEDLTNDQSQITNDKSSPTFVFDGLSAKELLNGYWNWLWDSVQKDANQYPDAKVRLAEYKKLILENETSYDFLKPEMQSFTPEQLNLFRSWMNQWIDFLNRQLKPEKPIMFWTKDATEDHQERLLDYLKSQKRQPQRYKCLAVAVYALRQLGYVTYNISVPSIAQWLSERLQNDYSSKTGLYQFRRAWNELSRYTPSVQDEVALLAEYGIRSIK